MLVILVIRLELKGIRIVIAIDQMSVFFLYDIDDRRTLRVFFKILDIEGNKSLAIVSVRLDLL